MSREHHGAAITAVYKPTDQMSVTISVLALEGEDGEATGRRAGLILRGMEEAMFPARILGPTPFSIYHVPTTDA